MTETINPRPAGPVVPRIDAERIVGKRLAKLWEEPPGIATFIKTVDHKRIGRRYLVTAATFFLFSGLLALTIRTQLAQPDEHLVSGSTFDELFTLHGTTMIFFVATPMLFGFGNFFVPLMLGTRDMAFPRLNALTYWVFASSGIVMFASLLVGKAPNGGWFSYVPLNEEQYSPGVHMDVYSLGLLFLGISTTAGAINFIATIFTMRAPGMALHRMPVFIWSILVTSFMVIFALPPLNLANAMLFLDHRFGFHFFDPAHFGQPLLWQHLFWLFGHPDVYIIVLPALGIVSTIIPTFCRRPVAAYTYIVLATVATGIIGFGVWVHHMFATGLPDLAYSFFSAASMIVTIPAGVQMFAWLETMRRGRIVVRTPLLFCFGFIASFVMGGVTGVMFGLVSFDQQTTDSYFVVAHFHYVLFGGAVFPMLAAMYFWLPKVTGRMLSERWGRRSFWTIFIGENLTFFPMHISGLLGMPRRVVTYAPGLGWDIWNLLSTIGSFVLAIGLLMTALNVAHSLRHGEHAADDPWGGETLEWATASPPHPYNFPVQPVVHSRSPMWDELTLASMRNGALSDERVLSDGHQAFRTDELDGEVSEVVRMPEESAAPFLVALSLLAITLGLLFPAYPLAIAGGALLLVAVAMWLWPERELQRRTA